jgi:Fur family ferric uptake transcriptional regulator
MGEARAKASAEAAAGPPQRKTRQRAAVLEALSGTDEFRSAQQWHELLRRKAVRADDPHPPIGLATVYRTLQTLAESGEVDAVRGDDGEALYRRCGNCDCHHHHLRCRTCGAGVEIEGPGVEEWAQSVAAAHGYSRIEHTIELTGVCEACTAKEG